MADDVAIKAWYAFRAKAIHEKVTAHDLLRRNGVSFRHTGDREEQFSCPFHGKDEKPSARVYPSSPRSPSHVWCYVCRERWDVIALWKKYNGGEDKSFHRVLTEIEKHYGITPPPVPEGAFQRPQETDDRQKQEFERLFQACESRLIGERSNYQQLDDMNGYLVAGSILDKAYYQTGEGHLNYKDGVTLLTKLMQRIGERVRSGSPSEASHS